MFGYVKPCRPQLEASGEFEAFQAVYCGLCHQMGRSFGLLAQMTLNYDFVFLAVLSYAQKGETPCVCKGRCAVNPFHKVPLCPQDDTLSYSADVAALMVYHKLIDNIQDSGFFGKIGWSLLRPFAASARKKAAARQPEADRIVAGMMEAQREVEARLSASVDDACEPTAAALASLCAGLGEENTPAMERLGRLLGRYIYLCDAAEDLEKDAKTGNYNPFAVRYLSEGITESAMERAKEHARASLYLTVGELGELCQSLDFPTFAPVIRNVLESGLLGTVMRILPVQEAAAIQAA
ncbi:MAG: DUF5685 family protein [Oscillospiraceae bacterium]